MPNALSKLNFGALKGLAAEDREQAERLLGELRERLERNPLEVFQPHDKQLELLQHQGHGKITLFLGGNRAGKTTGGIIDDIIQSVDRDSVPEHLRHFKFWEPPTRGRIVTKDFKQSHQVMLDKLQEWCPRDQMKGSGKNWWRNSYDSQARRLWFKNGSWIEFMSQEQDPAAMQAQNLHWLHFDEEPPYDLGRRQWEECMARLIDVRGSAKLTMTPLFGMSWIHDALYVPWQNGRAPRVQVVQVNSFDNPHVDHQALHEYFDSLSEEKAASRRDGSFVAFEGMIYPRWDPSVHKIDPLAALPPKGADRARTMAWIDAGARFPAVLLAYADSIGRVTVFDEIRPPQGTVIKEVCRLAKEALHGWGVDALDYSVIDPAALNRSDQTGRSARDEYARHGLPARPGDNAVSVGIGRVSALLDKPGWLRVSSVCEKLLNEFLTYRWKGSQRAEDAPREGPVKRDDHSLDALRYGVMSLPEPGKGLPARDEKPSWHYDMPVDVGDQAEGDVVPGGAGAWM